MSLRSMKKLMKKDEKAKEINQKDDDSSSEEEKVSSVFQGLQIDDSGSDHEETTKNEEKKEEKESQKPVKKNKRKQKKKQKKEAKEKIPAKDDIEDDLKLIEEMKNDAKLQSIETPLESALTIQAHLLNPKKELSLMFEDSNQEESKGTTADQQYQLSRRAKKFLEKNKNKISKKPIKKRMFIKSCEDIPAIIPKIAQMNVVCIFKGQTVYGFEPTDEYTSLTKKWEATQSTCDINLVVDFLQKNYFFPDAIMSMTEYFKLKGDFKNLMPLIERGIYVFEYCWCPAYNPTSNPPNTLLDFGVPLNYLYGKFIFNYIDMLSHEGCIKTALEFSKYLLSCDPYTDPFGMLLMIDYLILRSKNHEFTPKLIQTFIALNSDIITVPSILYAMALSSKTEEISDNSMMADQVGMILSVKDVKGLFELEGHCWLLIAISMYPQFAEAIIKKKGEKTKVDNLKHFEGFQLKSLSEILLHEIVKVLPKHKWMEEAVYNKMLTIFEEKGCQCYDNVLQAIKNVLGYLLNNASLVMSIRERMGQIMTNPIDFKRYSQINTIDYMEDLKTLTAEQTNQRMEQNLFNRFAQGPGAHGAAVVNQNVNPILLLLQTLLPWNNIH